MDNRLYLMDGMSAVSMTEQRYASEDYLQEIVEKNPGLLARAWTDGENKLFLISREQVVSIDGSSMLWLDHLLIGEDAIPTLVEVKRSTDTRVRREVIAQMLDYACGASTWDVQKLRASFMANNANDASASPMMGDEFWEQVATNLRAEHLRLVFVADEIPNSLRLLIEFMDRQMPSMEVYGVMLKPYTTAGGKMLLAANVIGNPLIEPENEPLRTTSRWDQVSFTEFINGRGQTAYIPILNQFIELAAKHSLFFQYGTGKKTPTLNIKVGSALLFTLTGWHTEKQGDIVTVDFPLDLLSSSLGDGWDIERIRGRVLQDVPDLREAAASGAIWNTPKYVYIEFSALHNSERFNQLKQNIEVLVTELRKAEV